MSNPNPINKTGATIVTEHIKQIPDEAALKFLWLIQGVKVAETIHEATDKRDSA